MKFSLSITLGVALSPLCSAQSLQFSLEDERFEENEDLEHFFGGDTFFSTMLDDLSLFQEGMESLRDRFFLDAGNHDEARLRGAQDIVLAIPSHPFLRGRSSSILPQPQHNGIIDNKEQFQVSFDLPMGLSVEDTQIQVEDGGTRLVIHGETHNSESNSNDERHEGNGRFPIFQWSASTSSFTESIALDQTVEVDRIVATFKGGRLTISAPKSNLKVKNLHRAIPVQDLDAIAAGVQSSKNKIENNRPHFLHKSAPFVQEVVDDSKGEKSNDTMEMAEASDQVGDLKEENTKESGDFGGSSL
ncbi:MAG: hypothetical protein SGILL_001548 [Bacillariaceae sp.]